MRQARIGDRHNLVVLAVHDQHRHVDGLEIPGEIGLGEGLDAVVMRLGAAHHALAPPVLDQPLVTLSLMVRFPEFGTVIAEYNQF
jgi:hypothetical protein